MLKFKKYLPFLFAFILFVILFQSKSKSTQEEIPTVKAEKRNFEVKVKTVGELEASKSTIIASSIKGDLGKIIYLVQDGVNVKPDDILVKMDPTPFEEKLEKLESQIKEQETHILTLEQTLDWEKAQAEHEFKTATFEIETSELELEKIISGDGPLEISKLKSAMQKAWIKYDELSGFSNDLAALQEEGFLNPNEIKQALQKLADEKEAYEAAQLQYESYVNHVYPMQIKKAETSLKRAKIKLEEVLKTSGYKIGKSQALTEQARQLLKDLNFQLREAKRELELTEIRAPAPGMVVHREEYRGGQRRKPRIGDVLVKNQALIDLPDLNSMVVKTKVREVDLFKIAVGKKANIQVDSYPHLVFPGKLESLGVLALSDLSRANEEKFFELRVALEKGDERLRPGMTTRVLIHAKNLNDCLSIPVHAIFEDQKQTYCYVLNSNGYNIRQIEIGACNEQWAEVISGLEEGENVCLANPFLTDHE